MKGYRVKKIAYSITAVVMVLVLSLPTVARASSGAKITTYECVKDIYTQGSWQDMVIEQTYCMSNDLYSYYEGGFVDMPFSLSDYNYYAIMKNSSIVMVLGFNVTGSMYACASSGDVYANLLAENRNESYIFSILEQGYNGFINDDGMNQYNYSSGVNFCFEGTWDRWNYDVASGTWSQSVNDSVIDSRNEQEIVGASSYSLLDTNCPLYSEYEFAVITCGNESHYSMYELGFDSSRYEYILSVLPSMTQLNQNLKYYDGENIVGGQLGVDESVGFEDIKICRSYEPYVQGRIAALVRYTVPSELIEANSGGWFIRYDITYNYAMVQSSGTLSNMLDDDYYKEEDSVSFVVDSPILTSSQGEYLIDFVKLCKEHGYSDTNAGWFIRCMTDYADSKGLFWDFANSFLGNIFSSYTGDAGFFDNALYYSIDNMQIRVKATLVNNAFNYQGRTSDLWLNLLTGENQSLTNSGIPEGSDDIPEKDVVYNTPDVQPSYNSDGSITYVTVGGNDVNVDVNVPSSILLTFANSLDITGIEPGGSGGSGGSSSSLIGSDDGVDITIEDDDYTDAALREDLRDGFGLLDNMNTDESSDGFLQLSAKFYEHLDGDLDDMLVFGMSSVIVIAILRMALRR